MLPFFEQGKNNMKIRRFFTQSSRMIALFCIYFTIKPRLHKLTVEKNFGLQVADEGPHR